MQTFFPRSEYGSKSFHRWFGNYCRGFYQSERSDHEPLRVKIYHSQRVRKEMMLLADNLGLDARLRLLAELTGLFHDIGRFEQFQRYRTFVDRVSVDHGHLGVEVLREKEILASFSEQEQHWVLAAIASHNQYAIDEKIGGDGLLLAKMIRDCDKLDIWRYFIHYYRHRDEKDNKTVFLDLPDTPGVSAKVYEQILGSSLVDSKHIRNQNDFAMMRLGWVFDINFSHTCQEIRQRRLIEQIEPFLYPCRQTSEAVTHVLAHVQAMAR